MRFVIYFISIMIVCVLLSACPVIKGTGNAVQATGEGVGHAVEGTGRAIGQTGRELAR